jgi:aspartokinase/homoserine dehydrogenase 1
VRVLKFGGTSLATPDRIRTAVEIGLRAAEKGPVAIVVSALAGITDALHESARLARDGGDAWRDPAGRMEERHREVLRAVAPERERAHLSAELDRIFGELRDLLHGVALLREATPRVLDSILSYGERLSAVLVAAAARDAGLQAEARDARELIVTDDGFGRARVDLESTFSRIRAGMRAGATPVITGFIGATPEGETTTLGRGGSDYTASLLGAALGAEAVEIWTDVDGVMSADPRLVPSAVALTHLSYEELMELSHFGAKVIYPPSVHPTRAAGVPLHIRNTLNPEARGTWIGMRAAERAPEHPVCGVSSIAPVALLRLEGDGMVGVPGIAMRLFGALAREGVSVILISQASSEHSVCFAISPESVAVASKSVEAEFALERRAGLIDALVVERELAVIAAVGNGMRERPGIAGRLFGVLGQHGVNVRAIAQGSSELNVSLAVRREDESIALNSIHAALFEPDQRTVELFLAGVGRVGSALLAQLEEERLQLKARRGLTLQLTGLASSRRMLVDFSGISPKRAVELLSETGDACHPSRLAEQIALRPRPLRVFVDVTASDAIPALYDVLLASGVAVVTANKRRLAGPLSEYRPIARHRALFHETTVGAGLPVVRTLHDLIDSGDKLRRVEGLLSGTLGFLMDRISSGERFSRAVREAYDHGYTEPNPTEDLGGADVARKLLILARSAGMEIEPEAVQVESLLPPGSWSSVPLEELWPRLEALDEGFAARQARAARDGGRLCYLARLDEERAEVGLSAVGPDHPCANVRGTENVIAFYTDRYRDLPLTVRGPGAGADVTAAGVFADILRAALEARA